MISFFRALCFAFGSGVRAQKKRTKLFQSFSTDFQSITIFGSLEIARPPMRDVPVIRVFGRLAGAKRILGKRRWRRGMRKNYTKYILFPFKFVLDSAVRIPLSVRIHSQLALIRGIDAIATQLYYTETKKLPSTVHCSNLEHRIQRETRRGARQRLKTFRIY